MRLLGAAQLFTESGRPPAFLRSLKPIVLDAELRSLSLEVGRVQGPAILGLAAQPRHLGTFNPSINKNSKRAAVMGRRDDRKVEERLYDERIMIANKRKQREAMKMKSDDDVFKSE